MRFYKGTKFDILSRELYRHRSSPEIITPLELIEWALDSGCWFLEEDNNGNLVWSGPLGADHPIGGGLFSFGTKEEAIKKMREHHSLWWMQRCVIERSIKLLTMEAEKKLKDDTNRSEDF